MKSLFLALCLLALVGCRPSENQPPVVTAPADDPNRALHEQRFGPEALAPDVQWRESGLGYRIVSAGAAAKPGIGATVRFTYVGRLKDGTVFDHPEKAVDYKIGGTIPGLSMGLQMLGAGGKATFFVPPSLGYGGQKVMGIPPNSGLIYDVEVVAVNP